MKQKYRNITLFFALVSMFFLFSGCIEDVRDVEDDLPEISGNLEKSESNASDRVFSLNYNRDYNLNPMTSSNADNILCTQLMYDNIFNVDPSFTASSDIITNYISNDGLYWIFEVDTSIEFWDGTTLTAQDVVYSIQRASIQSTRLKSRLASVWGVTAQSESAFAVTLYYPNMQLPLLLTVPVIKYGSIDETVPLGTGPYMPDTTLTRLTRFTEHKYADELPIDTIYLKWITGIENSISAFENATIDLVENDPTGILNLGYGSANEVRYFPTTNMHYLGFNSQSQFFSNELCRRAMTYVVNREHIVNDIMNGAAVEAALPMNPSSPLYNNSYAQMISYSQRKAEDAFYAANVQDYDDDGYREIMVTGIPMEIDIVFIVCSDSPQKVAAAKSIADNLTGMGISVTLKELTWDGFIYALVAGEFDMFYAEIMLTPDFNTSTIITETGLLNYGGFSDSVLDERISDYMTAPDDGRKKAADLMNKYITDTAPIIPVAFERHQVLTHRGVVSGMKPTQYNVFYNIQEWTIDLG